MDNPQTLPRWRARQKIVAGYKEYPNKGPIVVVDNRLYSSPSKAISARTALAFRQSDGVSAATPGIYYEIGENSDTLRDAVWQEYTWWQAYEPDSVFWQWGSVNDPPQAGILTYDADRDLFWLSEKLSGFPLWGRDPLATEWVLLPPNPLREGETVSYNLELNADYSTKEFEKFRDRGYNINNPCVIARYVDDNVLTLFVKACLWSGPGEEPPDSWTLQDTKYIRIDIIGAYASLLAGSQMQQLLGMPLEENPPDPYTVPLDIDDTVWASYMFADLHTTAVARANRGAWEAFVWLVELPKSKKLIGSIKHRLLRLKKKRDRIRQLKAFGITPKTPGWKRRRAEIANLWLEYRYGWRQIIFDYQGLSRLIMQSFKRMRRSYTATNVPFQTKGEDMESYLSPSITVGNSVFNVWYSGRHLFRAGVALEVDETQPWYKKLLELSGGLNVLSIAYELTKLSWVVDWAVNIGDCLRALGRDAHRFIRAWYTIQLHESEACIVLDGDYTYPDLYAATEVPHAAGLGTILGNDEDILTMDAVEVPCRLYIRIPQDPSIVPIVPTFGGLDSWDKVADLVSLVIK